MLSPDKLTGVLPSKVLNHSLFVFNELPSTNTFALELARKPIPQGTVILADQQTAGRGRLDRTWFSPPGANIYGSLVFSFNDSFQALGWIPLMAGMAIAQAIESQTKISINLKWPNDILIHEQKVGGILCESFKRDSNERCVAIGFGINVNLPKSALPTELKQTATSLYIHAQHSLDRHQLLHSIIPTLEQTCERLQTDGTTTCQASYSQRCSTLGKELVVQFPDGSQREGLAHAIGEQGQLQIIPSTSDARGQSASIVDVHAGDIRYLKSFKR